MNMFYPIRHLSNIASKARFKFATGLSPLSTSSKLQSNVLSLNHIQRIRGNAVFLLDARNKPLSLTRFNNRHIQWNGVKREIYHRRLLSTSAFTQVDDENYLIVSIIGPPNAGKSTLFNRLMCKKSNKSYRLSSEKKMHRKTNSKSRLGNKNPSRNVGGAIVSSTPGTTRDRRECIGSIGGTKFKMVDTAGVDGERIGHLVGAKKKDPVELAMMQQTLEATKESDLILLMFDAKVGITNDFIDTARWLQKKANIAKRNKNTPGPFTAKSFDQVEVIILANKLEGDKWTDEDSLVLLHLEEASRIGFGEAIPVSAEHGEGLADLAVVIDKAIKKKEDPKQDENINLSAPEGNCLEINKPLQLAILGRQNVGKSTLVNSLLNQNRVITGSTPGLTRDAISIKWSWNSMPVKLVDTAGIRRISQREYKDQIEDLSVQDAMRAMKTADVGVLVLDAAAQLLQRQELAIADAIVKEGRALVVAANKMDLLIDADYTKEDYESGVRRQIEERLPMLRRTPVIPMSSLTGECVQELMPVVFRARERWERQINTGLLNRWLKDVIQTHPPPAHKGQPVKIKYVMQTKGRPPTFLLFCNVDQISPTYMRYLMKNFQDTFEMFGMEVRMVIKKSAVENPYSHNAGRRGSGSVGGRESRMIRNVNHLKKFGTKHKKGKRSRYKR